VHLLLKSGRLACALEFIFWARFCLPSDAFGPAPLRVKQHASCTRNPNAPMPRRFAAMKMPEHKSATRRKIFENYCYHTPKLDELPLLVEALGHEDFVLVGAAAQSIGKLGSAAKDAADDLYDAAWRQDPVLLLPQAYSEALDALVSVAADQELVLDLVQSHFGHTNWSFLKDSLQALKRLGTPKACNLLSRIVMFAIPDLNRQQLRCIQRHFRGFAPHSVS
jgi:hypothetical protein